MIGSIGSDMKAVNNRLFLKAVESVNIAEVPASGVVNIDAAKATVWLSPVAATSNYTLNFRGGAFLRMDEFLLVGQSIPLLFMSAIGPTAYHPSAFQIDGSYITPKYIGGQAAIVSDTPSVDMHPLDIYSLNIIKTGNNVFTLVVERKKAA